MHRLPYTLLIAALPLVACVTPSKSLGAVDDTGDDTTSTPGDTSDTDGGPVCGPTPSFTCTVPYDGMSLGACGGPDFDDDCCMRPTCSGMEDCADGEACVAAGAPGLGCGDVQVDGLTKCECGADAGGPPRQVCLPFDVVPVDWCASLIDEAECNGAATIVRSEEDIQFCQWIDVQVLEIDAPAESCTLSGPAPRCLTIQQGFDPGCSGTPCAIGPQPLVLSNAMARFVDDGTTIEAFGVDDVFCGGGVPLGGWESAADPSFGVCAFDCSGNNPCAMAFIDYVIDRAESSEDAPVDDCGFVTLDDSVATWQAARDCALQHAAAGEGFRLEAEGQSIDSVVQQAYLGLQGESYRTVFLSSDGGGIDPYALSEQPGLGLVELDACEVAVGELCLALDMPGAVAQICPA